MAYVTDAEVKAWIGTSDNVDDALIAVANAGAKRGIDAWCGRNFDTSALDAVRYFTPHGSGVCLIDDAISITTVATDNADTGTWSTVWAATDWFAAPVGGIGPAGQAGWPFTEIVATRARWFASTVHPHVKVTAKWGWTAVPDDIALAARLYAAELFKLHEAPFGTVWTSEGGDEPTIRNNRPLRDLLQPYKTTRAADGRFQVA